MSLLVEPVVRIGTEANGTEALKSRAAHHITRVMFNGGANTMSRCRRLPGAVHLILMMGRFSRTWAVCVATALPSGVAEVALAQAEPQDSANPIATAVPRSEGSELPPLPAPQTETHPASPSVSGQMRQAVFDPDDVPPESPPAQRSRACPGCKQGIALDGWLGGGSTRVVRENDWLGFGGVGFTALYHYEWFEAGAGVRVEFAPLGSNSVIPTAMVGPEIEPVPWLRLELLADVGAESVSNVGAGFFSHVGADAGATQPYLGGRGSVSFLLGESRRFLLGWWLNGGDAIGETTIHPWVSTCFLGCSQSQQTFTIGGPSWSMGIRIGGVAALW